MKKLALNTKTFRLAVSLLSISFFYGCVTTQNQGQHEILRMEVETLNREVAELKQVISKLEAHQTSMDTMVNHLDNNIQAPDDRRINMGEDQYKSREKDYSSSIATNNQPEMLKGDNGFISDLGALSAPMLYKKGYNYVTSAEYYKGITTFKYFLEKYPDHNFADNAHYWSGECYYAVKDYQNALKHFNVAAKINGNKTPDALLKVGYTQSVLGDNESAIYSLNLLIEMFPGTRVARLAKQKLAKLQ